MKNIKIIVGITTLASVLLLAPVSVQAQDTSPPVTTTEVDGDDDSGKWGLAGLLGLLGLMGLKRRDHDHDRNRVHTSTTTPNR